MSCDLEVTNESARCWGKNSSYITIIYMLGQLYCNLSLMFMPTQRWAVEWVQWNMKFLPVEQSVFEPWPGSLCTVVFLSKTRHSHSASLHTGVLLMGTSKLSQQPAFFWRGGGGGYLRRTSMPLREVAKILGA